MTRAEFQKLANLFRFELGILKEDIANIKKELEKKKKEEGNKYGNLRKWRLKEGKGKTERRHDAYGRGVRRAGKGGVREKGAAKPGREGSRGSAVQAWQPQNPWQASTRLLIIQ